MPPGWRIVTLEKEGLTVVWRMLSRILCVLLASSVVLAGLARAQNIIALVVGAAAAAASGNGGAGAAAILGGSSLAQRSFLQFSITQEASADQAALSFLDRTGQSAKGLLQFFEILQQQELLSAAHQDPYMRTHPLTSQRVTYVREHVLHSRFSDVRDPPDWIEMHRRMKAKLAAFLGSPPQGLAAIKPGD